jgi:hypothetical protein
MLHEHPFADQDRHAIIDGCLNAAIELDAAITRYYTYPFHGEGAIRIRFCLAEVFFPNHGRKACLKTQISVVEPAASFPNPMESRR